MQGGVMRRARALAPLAIVSVTTLAACTAASVATAQVAAAAKGSGVVTDLVVDRLAYLLICNFFAAGAVAVTMWNSSRNRVLTIAGQAVDGRVKELRDYVEEVDSLVRKVSARMDEWASERQHHADILHRIERFMSDTEKRHYAEDVLADRAADEHRHPAGWDGTERRAGARS